MQTEVEDGDANFNNMYLPAVAMDKIIKHFRIGNNQIGLFGNHRVLAENGNQQLLEHVQEHVESAGAMAAVFLNCPSAKMYRPSATAEWEVQRFCMLACSPRHTLCLTCTCLLQVISGTDGRPEKSSAKAMEFCRTRCQFLTLIVAGTLAGCGRGMSNVSSLIIDGVERVYPPTLTVIVGGLGISIEQYYQAVFRASGHGSICYINTYLFVLFSYC